MGNLTRLKVVDLSHNKLEDITSENDVFRIPPHISEVYLSHNALSDLPWQDIKKASNLTVLDVAFNNFQFIGINLTELIVRGIRVHFEGNIYPFLCLSAPN